MHKHTRSCGRPVALVVTLWCSKEFEHITGARRWRGAHKPEED
jgi:hypothetical protein